MQGKNNKRFKKMYKQERLIDAEGKGGDQCKMQGKNNKGFKKI